MRYSGCCSLDATSQRWALWEVQRIRLRDEKIRSGACFPTSFTEKDIVKSSIIPFLHHGNRELSVFGIKIALGVANEIGGLWCEQSTSELQIVGMAVKPSND